MATSSDCEEVWESIFRGEKVYGAFGPRDVLIIRSSESLEGPDIVPRKEGTLTAQDKDRLTSEGIPEDCWGDDVQLMEARYGKDDKYSLLPTNSEDGMSRQSVLGRIRAVMNNTTKPGVVIHYIGPGKKHTGDWCVADGFITFRDIIEVHMKHFRSKCLEIVSDCSYSGRWVSQCREFLDGVGVQPCGHSARKASILLGVWGSCRSHEIPHTLLCSARGWSNDKNTGVFYMKINLAVEHDQHTCETHNTDIVCKRGLESPCALRKDYTWHKKGEAERTFLVHRNNSGWYYIQVVDDDETLCKFLAQAESGDFNEDDYGCVIKFGQGQDPPTEVQQEMERRNTGIDT